MKKVRRALRYTFPLGLLLGLSPAIGGGTPTCSDVLHIDVHGHHVVADYVVGVGHMEMDWPPSGRVGSVLKGRGAAVPGGPGPGFHFTAGIAPGASFCNPQARSETPRTHLP